MKKYISLICTLIFLIAFSSVYAADIVISPQSVAVNGTSKSFEVYNIDGNNFFKLRDIAYVLNGTSSQFSVDYNDEQKLIETYTSKGYVEVGGEMAVGTDKSSTAVPSAQKLLINGTPKSMTAYNIGGNNFFKLRELGEALDFIVDYDATTNLVIIKSKENKIADIINIEVKNVSGIPYVELTANDVVADYNFFNLQEPERIILDISNSNLKIDTKEIIVSGDIIEKVRIGNQGNNVNRIVLDVEEIKDYTVVQSKDKTKIYLIMAKDFPYTSIVSDDYIEENTNEDISGETSVDNSVLPVESGENVDEPHPSGETQVEENLVSGESGEAIEEKTENVITEEMLSNRVKVTGIKYSATTNKIKVTTNGKAEYDDFTLTGPNRIVVDIQNAVLDTDGPTTIVPKNNNITSIRFSQNDTFIVRVVIDVNMIGEYKISSKDKLIEVTVDEIIPGEVDYEAFEDYATFTLHDVKKKVFTISESSKYNTYTLKYSSSKFAPTKNTMKVKDDFIEDIQVTSSKIVLTGNGNAKFTIKQVDNDVVVKIVNEEEEEDDDSFVVLLDAGHGGSDPGACNGDDYEKVYNLAIMLKLKELLEDTDGIKVYASRTTDKYIDRDGRVAFATGYPEADLYVSVHNNSSSNKNYDGTLVMYHNGDYDKDYGITSKEVAEIVLNELVSDLGTRSWGVRDPLDQVYVLYYSELPSIMCEVSFVSNDAELARLKTDKFQQTAAEAIYNGIMKAKAKMEK